jgi:integrase
MTVQDVSTGADHTVYSLGHTYATMRISEGVGVFQLAANMGTSVKMLEIFYGQTLNRPMASELPKARARKPKALPWE